MHARWAKFKQGLSHAPRPPLNMLPLILTRRMSFYTRRRVRSLGGTFQGTECLSPCRRSQPSKRSDASCSRFCILTARVRDVIIRSDDLCKQCRSRRRPPHSKHTHVRRRGSAKCVLPALRDGRLLGWSNYFAFSTCSICTKCSAVTSSHSQSLESLLLVKDCACTVSIHSFQLKVHGQRLRT